MTDQLLIEKIKKGDKEAMDILVKRHYNAIFSFVYRKTGHYHTSYDITQEIFIKMMKSLSHYKNKNQFNSWLFRIAVNHCNDFYRGQYRHQHVPVEEIFHIQADDDPHQEWINKINGEIIRKLVLALPDYQRDVIILRFYNQLKFREIATITDSPEATIKSRYRQGLNRLKQLIKEENNFE